MTLDEAYIEVVNRDDDPACRTDINASMEMKQSIVEEIMEAMQETREAAKTTKDSAELIKPWFNLVAFFLVTGIEMGRLMPSPTPAKTEERQRIAAEDGCSAFRETSTML